MRSPTTRAARSPATTARPQATTPSSAGTGAGLVETILVGDSADDADPTTKETFAYGPDGRRYHRESVWNDGGVSRTDHTFYAGAVEERLLDGHAGYASVQRTRVAGGIVEVRTLSHPDAENDDEQTEISNLEYLHRDHLGSIEAVTNASGAELLTLAYDPFGARRKADWTRSLGPTEIDTLARDLRTKVSRGYSDHEHLDRAGFVHMNGRVYDPRTGRFLSPDPIVEDPAFSQSWNSYSYVANSPLSLVDATGLSFAPCPLSNPVNMGGYCAPASSPGVFGGRVQTILSAIHRVRYGTFVYQRPSVGVVFGDEGFDFVFGVVRAIGVVASVTREIIERRVRIDDQGETGEPISLDPPIRRAAAKMQAAAAGADARWEHEGFRTYLGCRGSDYLFGHCYVVITEDGEIHKQYSVSGSDKFLKQGSMENWTYEQDNEAFKNKTGQIYEIQPPEGVTQEEFKYLIIKAAEGYDVPYDPFLRNSNAAAGYVIMEAGGKLPGTAGGIMGPSLRLYDPTPIWQPPAYLQ